MLFICNDTKFFYSHRIEIASALVESGWIVDLVALENGKSREIRARGVGLHRISIDQTGVNPIKDLGLFFQLLGKIKEISPELIHAVTIKPILYGGLAARLLHVPAFVATVTGLGYAFTGSSWARRLLRQWILLLYWIMLNHHSVRLIFQNPDDRDCLAHHLPRARTVARLIRGSGVDLAVYRPSPLPPGPIVVLLPARLLWDKGVNEFVTAARELRLEFPDARFVLAGESPDHNRSRVPVTIIERWANEGVIEWWGYREDMPAVYAACHIVCLPSYYGEGVPKCLLEAAACGRPIVTTDWPGCREVVENQQNGLLVAPRSVPELVTALRLLMNDRQLRSAMAIRSRQIAQRDFSIASVIEKTRDIYDELNSPRDKQTRIVLVEDIGRFESRGNGAM